MCKRNLERVFAVPAVCVRSSGETDPHSSVHFSEDRLRGRVKIVETRALGRAIGRHPLGCRHDLVSARSVGPGAFWYRNIDMRDALPRFAGNARHPRQCARGKGNTRHVVSNVALYVHGEATDGFRQRPSVMHLSSGSERLPVDAPERSCSRGAH